MAPLLWPRSPVIVVRYLLARNEAETLCFEQRNAFLFTPVGPCSNKYRYIITFIYFFPQVCVSHFFVFLKKIGLLLFLFISIPLMLYLLFSCFCPFFLLNWFILSFVLVFIFESFIFIVSRCSYVFILDVFSSNLFLFLVLFFFFLLLVFCSS